MDEFKLEDDLRPDSCDRRPMHSHKPAVVSRFAVSRHYLMIGTGVLVLLLLVIGMGSTLKAPTKHETAQEGTQNGVAKDINLSGSSALATSNNGVLGGTTDAHGNVGVSTMSQPQNVSVPRIASTPTQAQSLPPQGGAQQRIELPGNMVDALSSQQGQVDIVTQCKTGVQSTLPMASATVMNGAAAREAMHPPQRSAPQAKTASKSATTHHKVPTTVSAPTLTSSTKAGTVSGIALQSAAGNHYTLQLSSASRPDTLHAYAKQQKLQNCLVYPTQRNGKPWYVLVSGNYASSEEAKRAIVTLSADVQAKKPWVRPARQVQQELKK
ncbi:SPOR domain-containing protein [Serratia symbiotica]|uniref:SPOR domain-containing protein n=1 Tax=Serratia symbiotica TaxID=138074 RepID=UPI0030CEEFB0|nr:SPOR domain-containing protein [Serratia symbiotica]